MRNASERKSIRAVEKFAAERDRKQIEFLVAAMSTSQGRAWFHGLLELCHIFSDPFTGDALREAYSKGERNIGLGIYLSIVTHCPASFITMMKEASIQEELNDRRSYDRDDGPDGELDGSENDDG